jgi:uncharacterized membrane protein
MRLKKKGMQWLRVLHILSVSIWFGSVVCIGGLALICFFQLSESEFLTMAPWIPELYRSVVLPFAIFAVIQGIVYGFFSNWGFFRHRWVLAKWCLVILTGLCTGVGGIGQMFAVLDKVEQSGFTGGLADGGSVLFFISLQVLLLLIMIVLSVFKPKKRDGNPALARNSVS